MLHGGVPHHDSLGRAEAGDVSVELGRLLAGFHFEHALGRDVHPTTMHDALQIGYQVGMPVSQGFKLVEQWIDPDGLNENHEHDERNRAQPEIEPPASRTAAQRGIEPPSSDAAAEQNERQVLRPVAEPRSPMLHRKPILQSNVVFVGVKRQLNHLKHEEEQRHDDRRLYHTKARGPHGAVTKARAKPRPQHAVQHQEPPDRGGEIKHAADQIKRVRLLQFVGRQRVVNHGRRLGRGRRLRRVILRGYRRRSRRDGQSEGNTDQKPAHPL